MNTTVMGDIFSALRKKTFMEIAGTFHDTTKCSNEEVLGKLSRTRASRTRKTQKDKLIILLAWLL